MKNGVSINTPEQPVEFIQGFDGNPFSRISCRSLPNKLCTGTCGDCKKERETYKETKLRELGIRNTHGDPNFEDVHGTAEEVWDSWINTINKAKRTIEEARAHTRSVEQAAREQVSATLQ